MAAVEADGPPDGYEVKADQEVDVVVEHLELVENQVTREKPVSVLVNRLAPQVVDRVVELRKDVLRIAECAVPIETVQERLLPVPNDVFLEKVVDVVVEVPVERVVDKIVERVVERVVEVPVIKVLKTKRIVPIEKVIEKRIEVPVETVVVRRVEVPYVRVVERFEEVYIDRVVEKEVEVFVDRVVERVVQVPRDVVVERVVEVEVDEQVVVVPVEKHEAFSEPPRRVTLEDQGYVMPRDLNTDWLSARVSAAEERNRAWTPGLSSRGYSDGAVAPGEAIPGYAYPLYPGHDAVRHRELSLPTEPRGPPRPQHTPGYPTDLAGWQPVVQSTYADGRPLTPVRTHRQYGGPPAGAPGTAL
eukprot:EG_transcript_14441